MALARPGQGCAKHEASVYVVSPIDVVGKGCDSIEDWASYAEARQRPADEVEVEVCGDGREAEIERNRVSPMVGRGSRLAVGFLDRRVTKDEVLLRLVGIDPPHGRQMVGSPGV